jgi:hypothetical protein
MLTEESIRIKNLKHDSEMLEGQSSSSHVNFVRQGENRNANPRKDEPPYPCWGCGQNHFIKDCPYKQNKCNKCGRIGHKEGFCKSAKPNRQGHRRPFKRKFNKRQTSNKYQTKSVFVVQNGKSWEQRRKYLRPVVNGTQVKLQYDTGSDITIISKDVYKAIGSPKGRRTNFVTKSACNNNVPIIEELDVAVDFLGKTRHCRCFVTSRPGLNLFGIEWIELWNLWDIATVQICSVRSQENTNGSTSILAKQLADKYPTVFSPGLGLCAKTKVKLYLKPGSKPVFRPKRPVSSAYVQIVGDEIERQSTQGILSPVDHSDWAAPIVAVKKSNGPPRICGDFSTGLNDALEANQYPLPLPDEIFAKLAGCRVFSIIDLSDAYLQVEVDAESKELLTVNTHKGLYRYNRLVPGIKSAPGAFQRIIDSMTAGVPGVSAYLDDIIVYGRTEEEHRESIEKLLERIQEFGFKLRLEKCHLGLPQIKYLGHIVDASGLRPDPAKVEAIKRMQAPTDVSSLRSFLGAINFYGKFVPAMYELRRPLDQLLQKDVKWKWSKECQEAFDKFKAILQTDLLLTHFDPRLDIIVAADASNYGIGACLLHRFPDGSVKAVLHAARTLSKTEQRYSQIEKEGLAIIFAVKKFHRYIFGRHFLLQTDHKPLLSIFGSKKGIPVHTANRLQRWALTLLGYDFKVEYVSTTQFGHADVLSRLIDRHVKPDDEFVVASVHMEQDMDRVFDDAIIDLPVKFEDVLDATKKDKTLQTVLGFTKRQWPENPKSLSTELQPFFSRRDGLSIIKGCLFYADRLIVPRTLRMKVLNQLHRGHPGVVRMKAVARSYVFWPGIDDDVQTYVKRCASCASAQKTPNKHLLQSWPTPTQAWDRVHIDYAGPIDGYYFLLIVDAFSKWPEIYMTRTITADVTVNFMKNCISRFGIPSTIVSDNGTQFTSHIFRNFCLTNGIQHLTTAPFHPQSNGQAERFVDTFKRAVKKINRGGPLEETMNEFLSCYRSTPCPSAPDGKSPAEIMFGRKMKITLDFLKPSADSRSSPTDRMLKQNCQFNAKHGAISRSFNQMDEIYVKVHRNNKWTWEPGHICEKVGNVHYFVRLHSRRFVLKAHVNQLRPRYGTPAQGQPRSSLPLDVLLEEFCISPNSPGSTDVPDDGMLPPTQSTVTEPSTSSAPLSSVAPSPAIQPATILQPRRSNRTIVRPSRFGDFVPK